MTRYAVILEGVVVNVILWEGDTPIQVNGQLLEAPDHVGPGWLYDGEQWTSPYPPPEAPEEV